MIQSILVFIAMLPIYFGYFLVLLPIFVITSIPVFFLFISGLRVFKKIINYYKVNDLSNILITDSRVVQSLVIDNKEPLVDFSFLFVGILPTGERQVTNNNFKGRLKVGQMLRAAELLLPKGIHLFIRKSYLVSSPELSTGASFYVTLIDNQGTEVNMGRKAHFLNNHEKQSEFLSEEAKFNRNLLNAVLSKVGFVNYPTQWWHWSYGDKYWCARTGANNAIYGIV